jgi:glyoxylase-like metal-dependent hydrolase (beta-lactamase superfamily II)/8-oxo-dGTP pyrophosphatase MutT (NUDIX family)
MQVRARETSEVTSVRPAASVVLVRENGEVLWVRRGDQLRFAGGFYAFPGGRVDLQDSGVPADGGESLGAAEMPCVVAAARELFEETGVLAVPGAQSVPAAERKAIREALLQRPVPGEKAASFGDFLASHRLRIDTRWFSPAGRWVTPPSMPIRFDARFYLVDLPPGEAAEIWPGELKDGEWINPEDALRRWEAGSALLHPPAWHTLKALAWAQGHPRDALPLLTDPGKAPWKLPIREHVVERIEFQRGLIMVPLRTPTLPPATHTNCLLLGDDELWVVDPGSPWPEEQAILRETLDKLAEEGRRAVGVLLTHHHHDHTGGAQVLGLPIAATRETAARLDFKVDRTIEDGMRFEAGPRGWRALHLPGHTRGHVCLIEEGSGAIVAGDLVAGVGTVIIDPPEGDMKDYLSSLDRLLGEKPGCIYPAHGPVVPGGVAKLREYRAHRLEREERVLGALLQAGAPAAPADLVPAAYPDVKPDLYALAERSLLAHLYKLVREGRAAENDGRFSAAATPR